MQGGSFAAKPAASDLVYFYPWHTLAVVTLSPHGANAALCAPEAVGGRVAYGQSFNLHEGESYIANVTYLFIACRNTIENATIQTIRRCCTRCQALAFKDRGTGQRPNPF